MTKFFFILKKFLLWFVRIAIFILKFVGKNYLKTIFKPFLFLTNKTSIRLIKKTSHKTAAVEPATTKKQFGTGTFYYVFALLLINVVLLSILTFILVKNKSNSKNFFSKQVVKQSYLKPTYLEKKVEQNFFSLNAFIPNSPIQTIAYKPAASNNNFLEYLQHKDTNLMVWQYNSATFENSTLKKHLDKISYVRIYAIVQFRVSRGQIPALIKKLSITTAGTWQSIPTSQEHSSTAVMLYYGLYKHLNKVNNMHFVINIYIPRVYSAAGFYQLQVSANQSMKNIKMDFQLPHSKPGKMLEARNVFLSTTNYFSKQLNHHRLTIDMPINKENPFYLLSKIRYKINLEEILKTHISVAGNKTSITSYQATMQDAKTFHQHFTSFSEKIVPTIYNTHFIDKISQQTDLSTTWQIITKKLNKDIHYNFKKRELFFSGNLPYNNIKDMYLTAYELSQQKVGACPERSSLETSILRSLGIASRTATRLYHIYTEIYLPGTGWVSTSLSIRGIPLVESTDNKQSYFVYWQPDHPIFLKWTGHLTPLLVKKPLDKANPSFPSNVSKEFASR